MNRRRIPLGPDTRLDFYALDVDGDTVKLNIQPDDLLSLMLELPKLITGDAEFIVIELASEGSLTIWNESLNPTDLAALEAQTERI